MELAHLCGWDAKLADLEKRLRCSTCGKKNGHVQAIEMQKPRGAIRRHRTDNCRIQIDRKRAGEYTGLVSVIDPDLPAGSSSSQEGERCAKLQPGWAAAFRAAAFFLSFSIICSGLQLSGL